jgi:hypothetical protein
MTLCPVTGRQIETGIETDKHTLAGTTPFTAEVSCSICGEQHLISNSEVWVCETFAQQANLYPDP